MWAKGVPRSLRARICSSGLQAPRFFLERDEVVLSANVHNYLAEKQQVEVGLELEGVCLDPLDAIAPVPVTLDPNSEHRIDWRVKVVREGTATIRVKAQGISDADAMEMKFPVFVHGMLKTESSNGALRPDQNSGTLEVDVPAERRPEQTALEVRFSPSLAMAMIDAVPYLAELPIWVHGADTESLCPGGDRPRTLKRLGVDLRELRKKSVNLNAQEVGDPKERAEQWKQLERNPVFSERKMTRMIKAGLESLSNPQNDDGGWSWFPGARSSDAHITATMVHGLTIAKANDLALVPGVVEKGLEWLDRHQAAQVQRLRNAPTKTEPWKETADDLDALVHLVVVEAGLGNKEMGEFLYRDRNGLSLFAKAMLAVAYDTQGLREKRDMLVRNLEQFLEIDRENQTAHLRLDARNRWWHWYGSEFETQAWYLKLLARVKPQSEHDLRAGEVSGQ